MFLLMIALTATQPSAQPPAEKSDPNKIICHLESDVSSRIPQRVCRTQAQWDRIARDTEEDIKQAKRFGNYGDPTPN
jgi:hypothetical protein